MKEKNFEIKKRITSYEELLVKRFPYQLLIRCWSLMRRAEEKTIDFFDEYGKYITGSGKTSEELAFFEDIPLTEDGIYFLNLQVEDCVVTGFSIISK